eukprot:TRINITY_DN19689_c0_g1_i1.p1 TRINITY_DN19689_c0_g1~~TRINITY_DN19689_c0_g1_i1.p1  ORF type:complete len:184 (+),score=3.85 TRINITY_DN19689_c0_g1_i1:77-553(+)
MTSAMKEMNAAAAAKDKPAFVPGHHKRQSLTFKKPASSSSTSSSSTKPAASAAPVAANPSLKPTGHRRGKSWGRKPVDEDVSISTSPSSSVSSAVPARGRSKPEDKNVIASVANPKINSSSAVKLKVPGTERLDCDLTKSRPRSPARRKPHRKPDKKK